MRQFGQLQVGADEKRFFLRTVALRPIGVWLIAVGTKRHTIVEVAIGFRFDAEAEGLALAVGSADSQFASAGVAGQRQGDGGAAGRCRGRGFPSVDFPHAGAAGGKAGRRQGDGNGAGADVQRLFDVGRADGLRQGRLEAGEEQRQGGKEISVEVVEDGCFHIQSLKKRSYIRGWKGKEGISESAWKTLFSQSADVRYRHPGRPGHRDNGAG